MMLSYLHYLKYCVKTTSYENSDIFYCIEIKPRVLNLTLAGKFIGEKGRSITELKSIYHVNIWLKGQLLISLSRVSTCYYLSVSLELPVENEKKKKKFKNKKDYRKKYWVDEEIKLAGIEGTRANIDKCLDKLKEK